MPRSLLVEVLGWACCELDTGSFVSSLLPWCPRLPNSRQIPCRRHQPTPAEQQSQPPRPLPWVPRLDKHEAPSRCESKAFAMTEERSTSRFTTTSVHSTRRRGKSSASRYGRGIVGPSRCSKTSYLASTPSRSFKMRMATASWTPISLAFPPRASASRRTPWEN